MLDTKMLVKDVGTMLDGPQAVEEGLIDEVGGIARALEKLNELMEKGSRDRKLTSRRGLCFRGFCVRMSSL